MPFQCMSPSLVFTSCTLLRRSFFFYQIIKHKDIVLLLLYWQRVFTKKKGVGVSSPTEKDGVKRFQTVSNCFTYYYSQ
jgi:hypothetical protein